MGSIKINAVISLAIGPYYLDKRLRLQPRRLLERFKVQRFKGSEVDFPARLTNEINDKRKKRDGINPEPGTLNILTQTDQMSNFRAISRSVKYLRSILLVK